MSLKIISNPTIPQKPLCTLKAIKEEWEQVSIQKGWRQKVHAWLSFESAPSYGKRQNHFELLGVVLLIPCSLWFGVFLIKHPKDADWRPVVLQKITAAFFITITLPITILGALIKGLGEVLPHEKIECDDSSKTKTHPLIVEACYLMTEKFTNVCKEIGFDRFYPVDGSLLGAVRHGGFIPWDDDVDLGVDVADMAFLYQELKPRLEAQGIVWIDNLYGSFKVIKLSFSPDHWKQMIQNHQESHPDQPIPEDLIHGSPNIIDLCGTAIMSDGSWASASSAGRAMFPMDYIPLEDETEKANPQQYIQFGSLLLPTFSNKTIIRFLKTYYGDDCLTHGLQTHSHGTINTCWGRIPVPKFNRTYRFKITDSFKTQEAKPIIIDDFPPTATLSSTTHKSTSTVSTASQKLPEEEPKSSSPISYLHLAFAHLKDQDAHTIWMALPRRAKIDALHHIQIGQFIIQDSPEQFPIEYKLLQWLKTAQDTSIYQTIEDWLKILKSKLDSDELRYKQGEDLLDFYYSDQFKEAGFYSTLLQKIEAFTQEHHSKLFYYISEQAQAAGWTEFSKQWQKGDYSKPHTFGHAIQAIERYLHTKQKMT